MKTTAKNVAKTKTPRLTIGERLKALRLGTGLSQAAVGAQGFISEPGWIKIENGQRSPSAKMLTALVDWLVREKQLAAKNRAPLLDELLTLKYLGSNEPFVRDLAGRYARTTPWGTQLLAAVDGVGKRKGGAR